MNAQVAATIAVPSLWEIASLYLFHEGSIKCYILRKLDFRVVLLELGLREQTQKITRLLTGFYDLLHQPLNHWENVLCVQTANLIREQLERAFHLHKSLFDVFSQLTATALVLNSYGRKLTFSDEFEHLPQRIDQFLGPHWKQ